MDQARIIVIASVIFCMIATLALLHRNSKGPDLNLIKTQSLEHDRSSVSDNPEKKHPERSVKTKWQAPATIKFSPPPEQIFAVEDPEEFTKENIKFKDHGKIVE